MSINTFKRKMQGISIKNRLFFISIFLVIRNKDLKKSHIDSKFKYFHLNIWLNSFNLQMNRLKALKKIQKSNAKNFI